MFIGIKKTALNSLTMQIRVMIRIIAWISAALLAASTASDDWLQWGGPQGDFTVASKGLAEKWPEGGPKLLWKRPLGPGYSSILYKDGRLYTLYREGSDEIVVSLDATTGGTFWVHRYARKLWPEMVRDFGLGPNATPLIASDRILSISIDGQLRCLDLSSGKLIWKRDLPAEFGRRKRDEEYGYSASPLLYQGRAIVQVGGDRHAVIAVDPRNGADVWKSAPGGVSYAQPGIFNLLGGDQYLYFSPQGINALDPSTGERLWSAPIPVDNGNHLTPAVKCDDEHVWVSSQFVRAGGRLLKITRQDDGAMRAQQLLYEPKLRASHWPLIRIGDTIYGSTGGNSVSAFTAFDWRSGRIHWRQRGFHKAQALYADGKLLFLDEAGQLAMAKVSPSRFEVLDRAQLTDSVSWTLPTLVGTTLFVRDGKHILALDLSE